MEMKEKAILVVDDEGAILDIFDQVFDGTGFRVVRADCAETALEILEEKRIDVMFLDLHLPQMNGIELCRIVKSKFPHSVVYAMTGYSNLYEVAACHAAGFDDYFEKPVGIQMLREAAEKAFARTGA